MAVQKHAGFSAMVTIFILLIASIGLGAWYVWDNQNTSETSSSEEPKSESTTDKTYLTIKEWGIRFELPSSLQEDVTYTLNNDILENFDYERMDFASNELTKSDLKCSYDNSEPKTLAYIFRDTQKSSLGTNEKHLVHLGNYYYIIGSLCDDYLTDETRAQVENFFSDFYGAAQMMQTY